MSYVSPASRQSTKVHVFFKVLPMKQQLKFRYGLKFRSIRPINCGIRQFKRQHMFFESCTHQVDPVNKLYSLAQKVQQTQTFFVPAKKKKGNQVNNITHACCLSMESHNFLMWLFIRGTQREYCSKPLKHSIVKRVLVFKWQTLAESLVI